MTMYIEYKNITYFIILQEFTRTEKWEEAIQQPDLTTKLLLFPLLLQILNNKPNNKLIPKVIPSRSGFIPSGVPEG